MNKVVKDAKEAIKGMKDGQTFMLGGFGLCGIPENTIKALVETELKDLTCISNNAGVDNFGLGSLLRKHQIKKMISSYVGENKEFERQMLSGELEVDLVPQGTLAERIRAGGAGIPAFFTPASVNTPLADGKESRVFDGVEYVMEYGIKADFSLVKCEQADHYGNLTYHATARNFGPIMCTAAKTTIVQAKKVVDAGTIDPEIVVTPGIFVKKIVEVSNPANESDLVAQKRVYPW